MPASAGPGVPSPPVVVPLAQPAQAKPPPIQSQPQAQSYGVGGSVGDAPHNVATVTAKLPPAPKPGAPPPVTVDPRDATYYANAAKATDAYQNRVAAYGQQGADATASTQLATNSLDTTEPRNAYLARAAAARQGLLNTGYAGEKVGEQLRGYAASRARLTNALSSKLGTLASETQGAGDTLGNNLSGYLAAAVTRAANADLRNLPAANSSATGTSAPKAPHGKVGPAIQAATRRLAQNQKKGVF
jgi:hypothetical protein